MDKRSKKRSLSSWRSDYPLLFNAAMIVVAVGVLSLAAHLAMQAGTRHSARRTVPDMTGMPYELALSFGADDVDGTIDDSTKIYSMAGAEERRPTITADEIRSMAARAGWRAVERDTHYNEIADKR